MNLPCSSVQAAAVQLGSYLTRQRAERQLWSELRLQRPALQRSAGNVCLIRHTTLHRHVYPELLLEAITGISAKRKKTKQKKKKT